MNNTDYMLKKLLFSTLIFSLIFTGLSAQNLISDPSFESFDQCPETYTQWNRSNKITPYWSYPSIGTPDYFNRCSKTGTTGVPRNFAGYAEPRTGDGYMGLILMGSEPDYREYLQTPLIQSLQQGKKYCVTIYYKIANRALLAVDNFGIYFSPIEVRKEVQTTLGFSPQIKNPERKYMKGNEWQRLCGVYTARGGEQYVVIGNFGTVEQTSYKSSGVKPVNGIRQKRYSYYYVDDFSVRLITDCDSCPCMVNDLEFELVGGEGKISTLVRGGVEPYNFKWSNDSTTEIIDNLPAGKYTLTVSDENGCSKTKSITISGSKAPEKDITKELEKIEEGQSIVLENIFFEFDKSELLPESYIELDKVVDFILNKHIKLMEISGHTDSKGSDSYNIKLSRARAKSVVDYIISKGVSKERLKSQGYGSKTPVATNETDEGRQKNRRVEFKILKK